MGGQAFNKGAQVPCPPPSGAANDGMKMFMNGKPNRFGLKLWVLCGVDGFPYCMKISVEKEIGASADNLGTRVIEHLVDVIIKHSNS